MGSDTDTEEGKKLVQGKSDAFTTAVAIVTMMSKEIELTRMHITDGGG